MAGAKNQVFENREVMLMKFRDGALALRDVKNEECSPEFIENKGARKVLLMS
ncbi:MAG: hypothetical protein ABSA59_07765 [Terriglobia bacterium]